ncbi:MAG: HU family DNA-binding protein [Armatimonadetes bacterium]|nr:HU family DNA-binding protein [Armatimonadota bacterium]MDW8121251.1 HU family DNA-binding protein [Armatimonadota bacterium]
MTKAELIRAVVQKTGLGKKEAASAVDAVFATITETIKKGGKKGVVNIAGFGKFAVRHRPARTVRNPRTGEEIRKPATKVPVFRPSKTLKEAVL